jgi:hypothetical protein
LETHTVSIFRAQVTELGSGALVYDRGRKAERMRPINDKVCEKGVWTNRESSSGYRVGGRGGGLGVKLEKKQPFSGPTGRHYVLFPFPQVMNERLP